jgi:hypothetical protein
VRPTHAKALGQVYARGVPGVARKPAGSRGLHEVDTEGQRNPTSTNVLAGVPWPG